MMAWDWAADLEVNSKKRGRLGAVKAFILDPSFTFVTWVRLFMFLKSKDFVFSGVLTSLVFAHIVKTFSCEMNYQITSIGRGFRVPHPIGIVIGGNASIGDDVTIFQNVTIGRKLLDSDCEIKIDNHVKIFAGAVVLGPIELEERAIVAANAVVTKNVSAGSTVYGFG